VFITVKKFLPSTAMKTDKLEEGKRHIVRENPSTAIDTPSTSILLNVKWY
jgi:hypothetical protein